MTTESKLRESGPSIFPRPRQTTGWLSWLTTVDHKRIGLLYIFTSVIFFALGGVEALLMRIQLARPEQQFLSPDTYNQMFTMHGVTMVFFAIMPLGIGFANYLVPLMIGARDLAFPRLNAFGFWVFALAGLFLYTSFVLGGAPDVGWTAYAPLTSLSANPNNGVDFFMLALLVSGIGTLVTAMNLIVTIVNMRAPGMTMMRLPVFVWMMLVTSFIIVFAFPPLTIALFQVLMDRTFGTLFYVPEAGALPILWQHLFWIFGHPEVYIVILPAFGVISEVVPTFSRKPLFGYPLMVLAGIFIGFMGFTVWSHHMFVTGLGPVANTTFALTSFTIGIPTGIKVFNWIATMWGGSVRLEIPMLYAIAFLLTFVLGGITGVMVAVPPFDAQAHDTYFVVAHFHYIMAGGALMAFLAGLYYWFPKINGRMLSKRLGLVAFWLTVGGFHLVFFPQHFSGLLGMVRRVQTYESNIGLDGYAFASSMGTFVMGIGLLLVLIDVVRSARSGEPAGNDPWDARTLEWATTSPPPPHDFGVIPAVNDRDPVWVAKHPELIERRDVLSEAVDDHTPPPSVRQISIHMPGQSWYPFLVALGIFIGCYAVLFENVYLGLAAAAGIFVAGYAWAFEGVGGGHIDIEADAHLETRGQ